jgi:hypothetical protein
MRSARRQKRGKLWGVLPFQLEGTDGTKGEKRKGEGGGVDNGLDYLS